MCCYRLQACSNLYSHTSYRQWLSHTCTVALHDDLGTTAHTHTNTCNSQSTPGRPCPHAPKYQGNQIPGVSLERGRIATPLRQTSSKALRTPNMHHLAGAHLVLTNKQPSTGALSISSVLHERTDPHRLYIATCTHLHKSGLTFTEFFMSATTLVNSGKWSSGEYTRGNWESG